LIVGGFVPAQYFPLTTAVPSHASCWALVDPTNHAWDAAADAPVESWAVLVPSTYNDYCLGENFMIVANEEFPLIADENAPLIAPPDSGFSLP